MGITTRSAGSGSDSGSAAARANSHNRTSARKASAASAAASRASRSPERSLASRSAVDPAASDKIDPPSKRKGSRAGTTVHPDDSVSQAGRLDLIEDDVQGMRQDINKILAAITAKSTARPPSLRERIHRQGVSDARAKASTKGKERRREATVEEEGEDNGSEGDRDEDGGLGGIPLRGPYGTFSLALNEQFSHIEETDFTAAIEGRLDPNRLHRLLHPQSPYFVSGAHSDELTSVYTEEGLVKRSNSAVADGMFKKLCKGLPTPAHFLTAMSVLTVLMSWHAHRQGARDMIRAISWYANHIVELSANYTWESCLRTFVDHAKPRLLGKFSVRHWFDAANASQQQKLLIPKPTRATAGTSSAPAGGGASSSGSSAPRPVCNNYNTEGKGCTYKQCRNKHICSDCKKAGHAAFECSK